MVPLGHTGRNVLHTIDWSGRTRSAVENWLGPDSGLHIVRIKMRADGADVVLTGSGKPPRVADLESALLSNVGANFNVRLEVFPSMLYTSANEQEKDAIPDEMKE